MGRTFRTYLAGESVFCCKKCNSHITVSEMIISKAFNGQHGRAMLVHSAANSYTGEAEDRDMRTGRHTVRDLFCAGCNTVIGWRYDFAYELTEKYKEGRYILERELIVERPEVKSPRGRPIIEEIIAKL